MMNSITGRVSRGHGVASGVSGDARFPGGTLAMQLTSFAERGLDLSDYHLATINLSITPATYEIGTARWTFPEVKWHPTAPAETFSFFECRCEGVAGLIYYPHPETKPEHEQPDDVIELLLERRVDGIAYGDRLVLEAPTDQIRFIP